MSTLTVEIDVCDDDDLVEEAAAVGCTAVATERSGKQMLPVYQVSGPREALVPLLALWGYEQEGDYTII